MYLQISEVFRIAIYRLSFFQCTFCGLFFQNCYIRARWSLGFEPFLIGGTQKPRTVQLIDSNPPKRPRRKMTVLFLTIVCDILPFCVQDPNLKQSSFQSILAQNILASNPSRLVCLADTSQNDSSIHQSSDDTNFLDATFALYCAAAGPACHLWASHARLHAPDDNPFEMSWSCVRTHSASG
jgi:hypothetical protein